MARKILITSALPYVNNVPHLGNLIGATLSADVFARFSRSRGHEVLYVCGTDEHGTATETKAREEGVTPKQLCDKYYALHKQIYTWFGISFDVFGRTSDQHHIPVTQHIFKKLEENGYIIEEEVEQLYSEQDKMFLADRYVLGTCPHCKYEDARGDQCDKCGKLLTPLELINPRSALSNSKPVIKKTKHLFIDLPKLEPKLVEWLEGKQFSENTLRTTKAWLRDGLKPRSITRDLSWGVPVPKKGYEHKVFYVWFDAPIGYISMTHTSKQGIDYWWKNADVELYQFMGKDNIPFHSVIFPCMLLGSAEQWTLVKHINTTEFLNYEDTKFSKSRGTGVFGDDAMSLGLPPDVFRYYLLTNRPETADTVFSWQDFQGKLNGELVANLGNLVNRTTSFINQYFDGKIPSYEPREADTAFWAEVHNSIGRITTELEEVHIKDALHSIMRLSSVGNGFFQQHEPWRMRKEDPPQAAATIATLANFLVDLAILIEPFLPHTAQEICKQLNTKLPQWNALGKPHLHAEHHIHQNVILFNKVEDKTITEYKQRFAGKQQKHQDPFAAVQLKVAKILSVEKHPNADKLYIEHLDLGSEKRTIVSGLAKHYTPEELTGKHIVVVANLAAAKLRGVESQGMLLAAENEEGVVGVITTDAPPGTLLTHADEKHSNEIISYELFSQLDLEANEKGLFCNGKQLHAGKHSLHADKHVHGKVK
jgi:methionyl-tRNA synthetase